MGKKKNKKHDIWDLSYEEQQENLMKFDEFLAGKTNDMFVNNTGTDFEAQLFSMIDTRKNQETIADDSKPKTRYFDQYGIFQYHDDTPKEGQFVEEDDVERYVDGTIDNEDILEYTPVSFDVDNELHMLFITSQFERVGLKLDTHTIPDDTVVDNEQALGRAFIDYSVFNTIPFALTDNIDDIVKAFNDYGIEKYNMSRFRIIYDENDTLYRCYIVDTDSVSYLRSNVVKSFMEYGQLVLELESRSINDINWGYFYDSSYNRLDDYCKIIIMDRYTQTGDRPLTEEMIGEFGYIITTGDIYGVISPLLEAAINEDDIDGMIDTAEKSIDEAFNSIRSSRPVVATLTATPVIKKNENKEEEVIPEVAEVVIDVEDLKNKMQTTSEEQPISETTSTSDDKNDTEENPVSVPDEIEVTEADPDEIDFDDLSEIPVIRKPKKK